MKVLIVFNHPAPYKVDLFNEISKDVDIDVYFERNKARNRPTSFYKNDSISFKLVKEKGFSFNIGNENVISFGVKNYIKKNVDKYDLIVMNGYSTFVEMFAINYMKKKRIPFVLLINGGIKKDKELFIKRALKRKYISCASSYLSPGYESDKYLMFYGADQNKIHHYPYSSIFNKDIIDKPLTSEEKNKIKQDMFLPMEKLYICPNQFIPRKNNLLLIKQFEKTNLNLLLVGNGKEKHKYLSYIKRKKLKNIFIWDFIPKEKLMSAIKGCEALISLSKEDIYGHSIIEGMACGLPIIASNNIVSAKEIIKNGENGFVLQKEDDLLSAINNCTEEMGSNSIKSAKNYTIEKTAKTLAKKFEELSK